VPKVALFVISCLIFGAYHRMAISLFSFVTLLPALLSHRPVAAFLGGISCASIYLILQTSIHPDFFSNSSRDLSGLFPIFAIVLPLQAAIGKYLLKKFDSDLISQRH
jgi:hypothetical protein